MMQRGFFSSLRMRLFAIVMLSLVPMVVLVIHLSDKERTHALADARLQALALTQEICRFQDRMIKNASQSLSDLSRIPQIKRLDAKESQIIFAHFRNETDGFSSLGAAGQNGRLFSSWPKTQRTIDVSGTQWYQQLEKTQHPTVSRYTVCRLRHKASIIVAQPIFGDGGQPVGILMAGLDLRYLNRHLAGIRYLSGTTVTVADNRGVVLARYPNPEQYVGKPMKASSLFENARRFGSERGDAIAPDDSPWINAFGTVGKGTNAEYVMVTIPRSTALAGANRDWSHSLGLLLAVAGLAFIGTWFVGDVYVVKRVKTILRVMEQTAGGNLSARTGVTHRHGELNQIAMAFDRMAERLERREREAEQVADDKVRRSRAMLQLIIDRMPIACIVWDPEFRTTLWNPAAEKIFGFSEDEALGKHPFDFIVAKAATSHVAAIWSQLVSGERMPGSVNENQTRDGRRIICEWSNTPLKGPDGKVIGVLSMAQDITGRKKAEVALRNLTRLLKILSECNKALVRAQNKSDLLAQVCRIIVDTGGYRMAWVGDAGCDAPMTVYPADQWNPNDFSFQAMADPEGGPDRINPIATAIQKARPAVSRVVPKKGSTPSAGGSVIGLPLMSADQAFGGLCICTDAPDAFVDEELDVLVELADDLAYGLETLRTRFELRDTLSALMESETRFRNLYDDAPVAYQALDSQGNILEVNKKWLRMLGFERAQVIGRWFGDFLSPRYRVGFADRLERQKTSGGICTFLSEVVTGDGRTIIVEVEKNIAKGEDGRMKRSHDIVRDITGEQESEKAIQALVEGSVALTGSAFFNDIVRRLCQWLGANYAMVTEIVDRSHARLIAMQADGQLKHDAAAIYSLSGTPCVKVIEAGFCVFPEDFQNLFPGVRDILELADAEGYIGAPLTDRNGRTIGVLAALSRHPLRPPRRAEDVMNILAAKAAAELERMKMEIEKERIELQLRQSQKMEAIGTLAGGISHDFNNILAVLFGYTEMSLLEIPEESRAHTNMKKVVRALHRARDLVGQILSFSRQSEETFKPFQLGPILKEAVKLMRAALPSTIGMRTSIDIGRDVILGDPTQIHQVLMNLCTNAAQAMEKTGGILEVDLSVVRFGAEDPERPIDLEAGSYLRLTVRDSGPGLPDAILERIFEPYFTTKEVGKGTGLGLAVVHGIVKSTGGAVTVESYPGTGTAFHVFFPQIEAVDDTTTETKPQPLARGEETVLLVDDEAALLDSAGQLLTHLGYKIVPHANVIDALRAFRDTPDAFDLVVTDQTMPRMTGLDFSREILAIRPDIPVILCTGFSEAINPETVRSLGIREVFMKPLPHSEFAERLRHVLG